MQQSINRLWRPLWALGLCLLLAGPVWASAPSPKQRLERGALCLEVMDYACVQMELKVLLSEPSTLSKVQKREALQLAVESLLSQKKWELARQELKKLLKMAPNFRPKEGAWPPKWNQNRRKLWSNG